jgi:cysteine desulfurase/selenocysteine lyase
MSGERVALGERGLFPELEASAYLAHAAISPVSIRVRRAVEQVLSDYARSGQGALFTWLEQRERLRNKLACLIGAEPRDVALTSGTTRGIVDLALCMPWQAGDTIALYRGEFPANVSPWQNAAELFDLELCWLPAPEEAKDDDELLAPLETALQRRIRLVAVSAVQFQTGFRMPLEKLATLCHAHGAELAVDAIQACGVVPVDVRALDVDYLASGAHKWLMGMEGSGFLYARAESARRLKPRTAGWLSHEEGTRFLFEPGELRYDRPIKSGIHFVEGSSASFAGSAALEAGLDPILELGPKAIFAHVSSYLDELERGLVARGLSSRRSVRLEQRSGILSVVPPAGMKASEIVRALRERRIFASMPDGLLRFAPHFANALSEVPLVLDAIDASLAELRR